MEFRMPADSLQKQAEQAPEGQVVVSGVIETARLRLRAHRDDDLAEMVGLIGNWQVARWVGNVPHPYTEADGRWWIASVQQEHAAGDPRRFAIALMDDDRIIGGVGLEGDPGEGTDE